MSHTPGPWHDSGLPDKYERVIVNEDGRAIAVASHSASSVMLRTSIVEESRANARLIAAAPTLLAALEAILTSHIVTLDLEVDEYKLIDAARAALRLACPSPEGAKGEDVAG